MTRARSYPKKTASADSFVQTKERSLLARKMQEDAVSYAIVCVCGCVAG